MKEIKNPPPQPEDPERSFYLDSQEDPDLSVELIDGVFHQLSKDNTLVAITANYPGLLPASKVTVIEVPVLSRGSIRAYFLSQYTNGVFAWEVLEAEGRACGG